ncbi:hypothetical protein C8J56DRAFT_948624 [Mycena floridula]|nr:hypothetical protein C8J56DRAFT_948624 [Mycena floridula]
MSAKDSTAVPDLFLHKANPVGPELNLHEVGKINRYSWFDIPFVGEVKRRNETKDRDDDFAKVIYHGYHMLRNDPRRQFAFGLTCEDSQCRFWFFSRSHSLTTEPFNIVDDPAPLIEMLYRLQFASDEQLGYDSTMKLVTPVTMADGIQYDVKVGDSWYRTFDVVLSDFKADSISGRATRVWKARKLGEDKKPIGDECALKDFWLEVTGDSEVEVYEKLKQQIKLEGDEEDNNLFNRHFMAITDGGKVLGTDGQPVVAQELAPSDIIKFLSVLPDTCGTEVSRHVHRASQTPSSVGGPPTAQTESMTALNRDIRNYVPASPSGRHHHRTLFQAVGRPYHELTDIDLMVKVLIDIIAAIALLWKFGRVHRDISTGNIYWDGTSGKLSDLEFMKSVNDLTTHDVRAGTQEFIAIEVQQQRYRSRSSYREQNDKSFRHNTLHDLESIWWILIWTFVYLIASDAPDSKDQIRMAGVIFLSFAGRCDCLYNTTLWESHLPKLGADIRPTALHIIDDVRLLLLKEYTRVEKMLPIPDAVFDGIHNKFIQELKNGMAAKPVPRHINFVSIFRRHKEAREMPHSPSEEVLNAKKRKREDEGRQEPAKR